MPTWLWIVIVVVAVLIVLGVIASALRARRTNKLKNRFGPEYDRVAADAPTRRDAESELREREKRRDELDIRPLATADRDRYRTRWQDVQAEFVDDPAAAVGHADALIQEVMRARGYPVDDFESRAADLSVDHANVVEDYREAHGIADAHKRGDAGTEQLRQAIQHYRSLFDELVESRDAEEAAR